MPSERIWHKGPPPHVGAEELRSLFRYDPETGVLCWAISPAERVPAGREAGTKHDSGYKRVMVRGKNFYVHRIIWAMLHDEWPDQIDHVNGDRQDNREINLRAVTNLLNCHNKHVPRATNAGVPNVYFDRRYGSYRAAIYSNNVRIHVGSFRTLEEAAQAVAEARQIHQSAYWPENARVPRIDPRKEPSNAQ